MRRAIGSTTAVFLAAALISAAMSSTAAAQVPSIVSNGNLGPISLLDGYYQYIFNTDAMTIDVYTSAGGYGVGAACPAGTYSGPGDPDGCARIVSQASGPDIVVWDFTNVNVATGFYVRGNRPAAIAATGTIVISGTVAAENGYPGAPSSVNGAGVAGSGPGGGGGGAGPGFYVVYDPLAGGGGGGGGGAGAGAKGGDSRTLYDGSTPFKLAGGPAGSPYLVASSRLLGGSGGGSGGDRPMPGGPATYGGAGGGNGGGAVVFAVAGDMLVSGIISAAGKSGYPSNDGGGGGGGGGGFVALQVGGTLTLDTTGLLSAAGGSGGVGPGGQWGDSYGGAGGGGIVSILAGTFIKSGSINVAGGTSGGSAGGGLTLMSLNTRGTGSGTIATTVGLLPAIACTIADGTASGSCAATYAVGAAVTLTATPAQGFSFAAWSGACTGIGPCTIVITEQPQAVVATFSQAPLLLTVYGSGPGSGTVTSQAGLSPAIGCTVSAGQTSGACSQSYPPGTSVTLTAVASEGSSFSGWSGDADCSDGVVTLHAARSCTAEFVQLASVPTVTTSAVTAMTETTATSGGSVTSDGGTTVTARGVCWSTAANPTTANSHTSDGTGTGAFASALTDLTAGTTYHVRAYATNSAGTAYGADISFTTSAQAGMPPRFTSDRSAVFQVLSFDSFTVTATGNPTPTLGVVGTLPDGVAFDPATGVLSGTPTSSGNYKFTFTAVNGVAPNATQSFMLHVQRAKQKAVPRTPVSDKVEPKRARRG